MSQGKPKPLENVRVLDMSNLLAGPMTGMFLADFGAEVIKVEHPGVGDNMRRWGAIKEGKGLYFKVLNRNKKTITLDLHDERAQAIVRRLAEHVDVVIENFRPGTLERWGIGYRELAAINPRIVMARLTGYGQEGPYSDRRTLGTLAEAFSGAVYVSGYAGDRPLLPPFGLGDASTAIMSAYGILLALYNRDVNDGRGQVVDSALFDGLFTLLGPHMIDFDQLGKVQERGKMAHVAPRNTYQTSDGRWVVLSGGTGRTFERIARAIGADHLLDDPRFADNPSRLANVPALNDAMQNAIGALTYAELQARIQDVGASIGPVMSIADIVEDPQYAFRGSIAEVKDLDFGWVRMQNVVPRLTDTPGHIEHAGLPPGHCNREIIGGLCGLSDEELDELRAANVI